MVLRRSTHSLARILTTPEAYGIGLRLLLYGTANPCLAVMQFEATFSIVEPNYTNYQRRLIITQINNRLIVITVYPHNFHHVFTLVESLLSNQLTNDVAIIHLINCRSV